MQQQSHHAVYVLKLLLSALQFPVQLPASVEQLLSALACPVLTALIYDLPWHAHHAFVGMH